MYKCFLLNYEEAYSNTNSKMTQSVIHPSPVQTLPQSVKPAPKTHVKKGIPQYFLQSSD